MKKKLCKHWFVIYYLYVKIISNLDQVACSLQQRTRNDFNILYIIFFPIQTFLKLRLQTQKISNNNKALENKKWDFA